MSDIAMPPVLVHSAEAEQSVLGALMLEPEAMEAAGRLDERHFFESRHAAIFAVIRELLTASKPADPVTLFERMRDLGQDEDVGGLAYLIGLSNCVASANNVGRHADIVREKAAHRAIASAADAAMSIAVSKGAPADKLDRIASLFAVLQREQVRKVPRNIAQIAVERTDYYADVEAGRVVPGWPTHIPALDRMLTGGLRPGGLYIVAARPSVGKSSFSESLGLTLARDGRPTLFLSQEMSEGEVADRAVANIGRVDYSSLLSGRMGDDGWTRATDALETLSQMPFFVDDQGSLSLSDIRAKASSVKGLQVLILDYLQLCAGRGDGSNRNSEIEEISRGLKAFAKERACAVIVLSQLNREVEKRANKRPILADLRDSGAIEQDADVVVFLWPVREMKDEGRRIVGCGVDKNRQGACGEFGLDFFGATQRWGESLADISQVAPTRSRRDDL